MRRRKRRHQDEEQGGFTPAKQRGEQAQSAEQAHDASGVQRRPLDGPLTAETAAHLQKHYGNAYVQRLIQRQESDEPASEAPANRPAAVAHSKPKEYEFQTRAKMEPNGRLLLNLKPLLDLRHLGVDDKQLQTLVKSWLGLGVFQMGPEAESETAEIEINTDGQLEMDLGETFLRALKKQGKEYDSLLNLNAPFGPEGLEAIATLHFDPKELDLIEIEGKKDLLGPRTNKHGTILLVQLKGLYPPLLDQDEQKAIMGTFVMVAEGGE